MRTSATSRSCCRRGVDPALDWRPARGQDRATRERFNVSEYLVDRQVELGRGGHVALRERGAGITYEDLLVRVRAAAAALRGLGVSPEERVVLVLLDGIDLVAAFLGALRIGAVPVPLNPLLPARDLAAIAGETRAHVALLAGERAGVAAELAAGAPELELLAIAGGDASELPGVATRVWADLAGDPADGEPHATWDESPGFWLCTSGTTGQPKLAMHRHDDLRLIAEGYAREVLAVGPDDRSLSIAPLFHAYGLGNSLAFPLASGSTAILEPARPPTPALVAELVARERPTLFYAVPTFYSALVAAGLPEETFASVRLAVSAGEALPAELFLRFRELYGVEILDGIGSTELLHIYLSNRAGEARPGTTGTPVGGYRIALEDEAGRLVGPGTPGQLLVAGETAATGYWCRSEESRRAFRGEWFASGDMYVCSPDGFYTYLGRCDDMFKAAGEWVSPAEVEAVLVEHPDVLEAVVVGECRPDGLAEPVARVVAAPGRSVEPEALAEHCRARLAGFKRPRRILVVESLPRTATGKIQRALVREDASAGPAPPGRRDA